MSCIGNPEYPWDCLCDKCFVKQNYTRELDELLAIKCKSEEVSEVDEGRKVPYPKFNYYGVTFTSSPARKIESLVSCVSKFLSSKMTAAEAYCAVFELAPQNTGPGRPRGEPTRMRHYHIYVSTQKYLDAAKIKNEGEHIKVDKLRTTIDVLKWNKYILKGMNDPDNKLFCENNNIPHIIHSENYRTEEWRKDITENEK